MNSQKRSPADVLLEPMLPNGRMEEGVEAEEKGDRGCFGWRCFSGSGNEKKVKFSGPNIISYNLGMELPVPGA
jgi:hypothetical protein